MSISLDIRLKRVNKVYQEGEVVSGIVLIQSPTDFKHEGITLVAEGTVNLQLSAKNVGILEAFYQSVKPIHLVNITLEVAIPGKVPAGKTEIPFEFNLVPRSNKTLYETYHGVFVNIQYHLKAEMKRSFLAKDLVKVCEFIVEYHPNKCEKAKPHPITFKITPDSLQNVRKKNAIPRFCVRGKFESTVCCLTKPFLGELILEHCELPIKSVELQLVRIETCGCAEGYARDGNVLCVGKSENAAWFYPFCKQDIHCLLIKLSWYLISSCSLTFTGYLATEIQNIQIGEGDVPTGLALPVYMIFPRLFTCPTLATSNFKVEFEINVVIIFQDDHLITENFPIVLTRA